jgi:hypothetical protein
LIRNRSPPEEGTTREETLKPIVLFAILWSVLLGLSVPAGAQDNPARSIYSIFDLVLMRPAAAVAGVAGAGLFVVTLPFTLPTGRTLEAARILVEEPFGFSFKRPFPDESLQD